MAAHSERVKMQVEMSLLMQVGSPNNPNASAIYLVLPSTMFSFFRRTHQRPQTQPLTVENLGYGTIAASDDGAEGGENDDAASIVTSVVDNFKEFALSGERMGVMEFEGDVPITNQVFNLIKNLVGCGVLALPSGIGAFASAPSGIYPAALVNAIMAAIFGYYFLLIGKVCRMVGAVSYREAWDETMGQDKRYSYAIAAVNAAKPGLCNIAYSMILADSFKSILEGFGYTISRTSVLFLITIVALLPLCLLKNLKALAPFSILGSFGMLLTAIAMGVRYFDGSYDPNGDGKYLKDIPPYHQPSFGTVGASGAFSPHILVFVCMLFEAYVAHYNAPRFYIELENRSIPRFLTVINIAFGASCLIYICMASFGFLTFGVNCDGYILNNYSDFDPLANMCRFAIAFSIVFTYPIVFIGFRDGIFDILPINQSQETSRLLNVLTFILLAIVTVFAVFFDNLGMLNAIGGGTIATAIVFVFPTLMYRGALQMSSLDGLGPTDASFTEVRFAMTLMWLGVCMGIVGVWLGVRDLQNK